MMPYIHSGVARAESRIYFSVEAKPCRNAYQLLDHELQVAQLEIGFVSLHVKQKLFDLEQPSKV